MNIPYELADIQLRSTQVQNCDQFGFDTNGRWNKVIYTYKLFQGERIWKVKTGEQTPLSFFLFDQSPFPHRVLIIGWWSYNPRTEAIEKLESVPIMYLVSYWISQVFGYFPSLPISHPIPLNSTLPCPLPPPPLNLLVIVPPDPTISKQPMPYTSALSPHRGPESAALRCTVQPHSASSVNMLSSTQIPPPP